jgi:anti-anti-sigma factor
MGMPDSSPFQVAHRAKPGAVVVELAGDFDLSGVETFRSSIEELISSSSVDTVVVDLRVSFIDSCGIVALLATRQLLADQDRELRFSHISAAALRVFELAGLTDLFQAAADDTT